MATNYKETLNLPQTAFPMKADLGLREPDFLKKWEDQQLYYNIIKKNKGKPLFVFHDGPPYANGHLHYGTILNKILKDIVVKYKNMSGHLCEYVPGWDCHGLPIELKVDKQLGSKKKEMSPVAIRKECRKYAEKFIDIQRREFKRLGCIMDWEHPYKTMSPEYEATIAREFGRFVKKGIVYRGKKPVHWCPSCATALAEAEVEYADHRSPSIFVKFRMTPEDEKRLQKKWGLAPQEPVFAVIWTTTPWTLPANMGITLHPNFTYKALRVKGEIFIVAEGLRESFLKEIGIGSYEEVFSFSAADLERMHAAHPFLNRKSLLMSGDHVTLEAGTGCVHTAPGHGQEDYIIGSRYGLETLSPVDARGRFTREAGLEELVGVKTEAANKIVIDLLKQGNALLHSEEVSHSYPHCWRCKKPVIFRATEQWFVSMEKGDLRKKAMGAIQEVEWIPKWGINRILGMIENRPDWCLSRQRLWGVPIIALACETCGETVTDPKWIEKTAAIFEKEGGSDVWFDLEPSAIAGKSLVCSKCGGKSFKRESDILDVWFDSGVSFAAVLEDVLKLKEPADLYLEGSDQHRGWFHTSLLASVATRGRPPYKRVLTHGFVVDAQGKKLSKSEGNFISPDKVLQEKGAEMLRFWVANEDYQNDIRFSESILTHLADSYRKIRNTLRYLLGNLFDFDPSKDALSYEKLSEIDQWALHVLQEVTTKVKEHYEKYEFHLISHRIVRYCSVELSSFYFDILKDRLYTEGKRSLSRRSAQTVLFETAGALIRLMAPLLSFTAEEAWQALPAFRGKAGSVFLTEFPECPNGWKANDLKERWERFFRMREVVTKALEIARAEKFLGNALEAKIILEGEDDQIEFLKSFGDVLPDLFIVSEVVFGKAAGKWQYENADLKGFRVGVERSGDKKCARCWKCSVSVGKTKQHPDICERCVEVIS